MRWIIVILSIASCLMPWRMALASGFVFKSEDLVAYAPCDGWALAYKDQDKG